MIEFGLGPEQSSSLGAPMFTEEELFATWKKTLARRYGEVFPESFVQEAYENLLSSYKDFISSKCVAPHFVREILSPDSNKSAQRLGEALLYERLSHAGLNPVSKSKGPDFCIQVNGQSIWLELVTPSTGDDSRIAELHGSHDPLRPCAESADELRHRTLLRISSAISQKLEKYESYISGNVVGADDPLVIVVNDALLCPDAFLYGVSTNADKGVSGVSLAEHAVNSLGPLVWAVGGDPGQYVMQPTYRDVVNNRPEPDKNGNTRGEVPVSLFGLPTEPKAQAIAKRATIISAVLQVTLREDYGILMLLRAKAEHENRIIENLISRGTLVKNQNSRNPVGVETSEILMKVVVAPT